MTISLSSRDALAVLVAISVYAAWWVYRRLSFIYGTPLCVLPGPAAPSWIYGNLKEIEEVEDTALPDQWFEQYGKCFVDREFFMTPRVWTLDPRAIHHVLTRHDDYPRPSEARKLLIQTLGKGLLFAQGDEHRQQRRIMNPAFGPAQIRDLTEIFVQKAIELRDYWARVVSDGPKEVNVMKDFTKLTLDVIGAAGFNYDFHALNSDDKPTELGIAFRKIFANGGVSLMGLLIATFPSLVRWLPAERARNMRESSKVIFDVGMRLVEEKKSAVARAASEKHLDGVERKDLQGRDLLTLLIKANMAKDLPESQKLSDEDVVGQIPTFLLAGHVTTSNSATWALYSLSQKPDVQQKLRQELLTVQTDTPTMEELNALPYLDAVVRETLRLHSPVTMLIREAAKDDVIPLSEPITDRNGKVHYGIKIAKGNKVVVPILAVHRSKAIWGEDALEFKPERWEHPPEAIADMPGIWGHLLTFIGGPRACIGYRFSLVEFKAILFHIIRSFEFELAVPLEDIIIRTLPLQRPSLRSLPAKEGFQLPIKISAYKAA
ncbi:cytochrome P450 [Pilatotrama ljubarskyi]|nr:cytochrome P450 [Pilatotrama ljubarskyi]